MPDAALAATGAPDATAGGSSPGHVPVARRGSPRAGDTRAVDASGERAPVVGDALATGAAREAGFADAPDADASGGDVLASDALGATAPVVGDALDAPAPLVGDALGVATSYETAFFGADATGELAPVVGASREIAFDADALAVDASFVDGRLSSTPRKIAFVADTLDIASRDIAFVADALANTFGELGPVVVGALAIGASREGSVVRGADARPGASSVSGTRDGGADGLASITLAITTACGTEDDA